MSGAAARIWEAGDRPSDLVRSAAKASTNVLRDQTDMERRAVAQLNNRLAVLQRALQQRLNAPGGITDFKRFVLSQLLRDVDALFIDTQQKLISDALPVVTGAADHGDANAEEPLRAVNVAVNLSIPALDAAHITATFDNLATLLTEPMQQFRTQVVTGIRRVALAGDGRMGEIQKLTRLIDDEGFSNAQFRAERILRMEISRVFNEATFQRLQVLGAEFPFLRKGWRAANDSRTRKGHREAGQRYARGAGIPLGQLFEITAYDERPGKGGVIGTARLRFPSDPQVTPAGSRQAKAATIMCRCNSFVDFDLKDFADFTTKRVGGIDFGNTRRRLPASN